MAIIRENIKSKDTRHPLWPDFLEWANKNGRPFQFNDWESFKAGAEVGTHKLLEFWTQFLDGSEETREPTYRKSTERKYKKARKKK